jgi:hypothetical protein
MGTWISQKPSTAAAAMHKWHCGGKRAGTGIGVSISAGDGEGGGGN